MLLTLLAHVRVTHTNLMLPAPRHDPSPAEPQSGRGRGHSSKAQKGIELCGNSFDRYGRKEAVLEQLATSFLRPAALWGWCAKADTIDRGAKQRIAGAGTTTSTEATREHVSHSPQAENTHEPQKTIPQPWCDTCILVLNTVVRPLARPPAAKSALHQYQ